MPIRIRHDEPAAAGLTGVAPMRARHGNAPEGPCNSAPTATARVDRSGLVPRPRAHLASRA